MEEDHRGHDSQPLRGTGLIFTCRTRQAPVSYPRNPENGVGSCSSSEGGRPSTHRDGSPAVGEAVADWSPNQEPRWLGSSSLGTHKVPGRTRCRGQSITVTHCYQCHPEKGFYTEINTAALASGAATKRTRNVPSVTAELILINFS